MQKQERMSRRLRVEGFLLYAPAIAIILFVVVYPMIFAVQTSLTDYRPSRATVSFVGIRNYVTILSDVKFFSAIYKGLFFTFGSLIPQIVLGLAVASLLNHPLLRWKTLWRGLAIMPWLVPTVAVAMIFRWMFNDLYGILNFLMVWAGILDKPKAWLATEGWAMAILILANVWRGLPLMVTMFLAGLQGIPAELYEAAGADGANAWVRFIKITLPLLAPVVMVAGILRFIWTFNFFDLPWVMTGGGPTDATTTAPIYAFKRAFSGFRMGEGSAITILLFVLLVIFSIVYFKLQKHEERILN